MSQIVDFRYSDTDYVAFLATLGIEHDYIEVIDGTNGKPKAYLHIKGEKKKLLQLFDDYKQGNTLVKPLEYSLHRARLNRLVKAEVLKYQASKLK